MVCSHAVARVAQASHDFFAHSPALVPSLIAFLLAPQFALRSWMAVQALPAPVVLEDAEIKRLTRRTKILLAFFMIGFLGAEVYLLNTASFSIIEYIITAFLGLAINGSLLVFIGRFTNCLRWSAHRSPMGVVVWKPAPGTVQKWKIVPLVLLATVLNVQLYQHGNAAIAFLASTALVYRFTSQVPIKKQSVRRVMLALLSWVFLTMVLVGFAIVAIIKSDGQIEEQPEVEPSPFSRQFQHYGQSFLTAIYASGPGALIAVCLRFDYSQHLNRTLLTETPLAIETIEAPVKPKHLTTGALLPRQTPSFRRPLYLTALLSWSVSQITTLVIFKYVPMGELAKDVAVHDLIGLFFAVPIMVISVCLVATLRGEFKDMWRYKENWFVDTKANAAEIKSAGEVEQAGEDAVPAYSDLVKEDELVAPAYAVDVKVPL